MDKQHIKNVYDYLRHFTTLSSGSILVLVAFLEKIIHDPKCPTLIYISVIGFLVSIIGAMTAYTIGIMQAANDNIKPAKSENTLAGTGLLLTWLGFAVGIFSIGIFALINF